MRVASVEALPHVTRFSGAYLFVFFATVLRKDKGKKNENIDYGVRGTFSRRTLRFGFPNERHLPGSSLIGAKFRSV